MLGTWLLAARATGEEDPASRTVAGYKAPEGCPDRQAFLAQVRSYLDPTEHPLLPPPFAVAIQPSQAGFLGTLRTPQGQLARELQAVSCSETALALAYIVALSISPNAAPGKGPAASSAPPLASSTEVPSAAPSAPSAPPLASSSPAPEASSAPPPLPPSPAGSNETPSQEGAPKSWVRGGFRVSEGIAPGWSPSLWLAFERALGWQRFGMGVQVASKTAGIEGITVRFTRVALEPGWCAMKTLDFLAVGLCGGVDIGVFRANAEGFSKATALILEPGAQARGELRVVGPLWLGVQGGVALPILQPGFLLTGPRRELYRVPSLVPALGMTLGVHFP